jgi:hypothetical protein
MKTICRAAIVSMLAAGSLFSSADAKVIRSRFLEVEPQAIRNADQPGDVIPLRLFSDVTYEAVLEEAEDHRLNGFVWQGRLVDQDNGWVVMVDHEGVMAGVVVAGDRIYRVRYAGSGLHAVEEMDSRALESSANDAVVPGLHARSFATTAATGTVRATSTGETELDVLMVYTAKAGKILVKRPAKYWYVNETDWKRAVESQAMLSIAVANAAMKNSKTKARFRLVGLEKIKGKGSKDFQRDLDRLMDPSDGFADNVHQLRDQYGADFVVLILGKWPRDASGTGFVIPSSDPLAPSFAFTVVRSSVLWWTTVAHELGHNMGLVHDPDNDDVPAVWRSKPFSRGYRDEEKGLHTIMAYSEGCADCWLDIPHYSNPQVRWKGKSQPSDPRIVQPICRGDERGDLPDILFPVCGTKTGSKNANSAKSIKATRQRLSSFRECRVDCD